MAKGDVKDIVKGCAQDVNKSKLIDYYCLNLFHINEDFLKDCLHVVLKLMRTKALALIGESGVGKSPVAWILALAMSRWHQRMAGKEVHPIFRTAKNLDTLRGIQGYVDQTFLLDDCNFPAQLIEKLLAFVGVEEEEEMTIERWDCTNMVMNQPRIWCHNKYDVSAEPIEPLRITIKHEKFMEMIHPLFNKKVSIGERMAILKRSSMLLVTKRFIYVRAGTAEEVEVPRFPVVDFLKAEAKPLITQYKLGHRQHHDGFAKEVEWEQNYLDDLFKEPEAEEEVSPQAVKQEVEEPDIWWSPNKSIFYSPLQVDSEPSPEPKARRNGGCMLTPDRKKGAKAKSLDPEDSGFLHGLHAEAGSPQVTDAMIDHLVTKGTEKEAFLAEQVAVAESLGLGGFDPLSMPASSARVVVKSEPAFDNFATLSPVVVKEVMEIKSSESEEEFAREWKREWDPISPTQPFHESEAGSPPAVKRQRTDGLDDDDLYD